MESERFRVLIEHIDQLNRHDPNTELVQGIATPRELLYAQRLTAWVLRLNPEASEALRIAARGQHVQRWTIPRERYPRTRAGYLRWRETLKAFHATTVVELMRQAGYPDAMITRVQVLISKRQLQTDAETQTLEDALCLVFLETQLTELRQKTPDEKMKDVVRKTWHKMSPRAHDVARALPLREEDKAFLAKVLSEG